MNDISAIMLCARQKKTIIPAFNIPYLPMMKPVITALRDNNTFGLIEVARLEWEKFQAQSLQAVRDEYDEHAARDITRLHLDHVPVIDEDNQKVDYLQIIKQAVELGYDSVMVDGSRLTLKDNIAVTKQVVKAAHQAGIPVEAELGAVAGHEEGPQVDYEQLFASGKGFTSPEEAARFVAETGLDWLSIAFGNIHGAISKAKKDNKKINARLNIDHLKRLANAANVPLVLHGGSGIRQQCIRDAVKSGICKINIATTIRQAYETGLKTSSSQAYQNVYNSCCDLIQNELQIVNSVAVILQKK